MARKPITHELRANAAGALQTPRERMWAAMLQLTRQAGSFTPSEVEDRAHPTTTDAVGDYLAALATAGLAELVQEQGRKDNGDFTAPRWRLLVTWTLAPRINKAGRVVTTGLGVLAMWRAAKVRKQFTPSELARDATLGQVKVSRDTARVWCCALARSGHLSVVRMGRGGIESVYALARYTGPHAPAITRTKVVFDRNTGEIQPMHTPQEIVDQLDGGLA